MFLSFSGVALLLRRQWHTRVVYDPFTINDNRPGVYAGVRGYEQHNADLNEKIAAGILSCFPAETFDATDFVSSLWMDRLMNTTADAQGLIDELLEVG